ncbi:MAG TPA: SDR family NAD(P)-dependent oxidoreductase [Candidatus Polarisedimenticolaceae bacterium]|nr:SDR family NAD(P)-dependent oxidoreductase [Candidatus Polarisedimenticolaceae bacterium]
MNIDFTQRNVVVTGGTGELGAAVVQVLLEAGAEVHVPCRAAKKPRALARLRGPRLHLVGGIDLVDERAVTQFYEGLPKLWGSIHAAGGFAFAPIERTSLEEFQRLQGMNGTSCFLCCREAVRAIRRSADGGGRIVNVAAMPALEPRRGAGMIAYTASKAVVGAVTTALAEEVASEGIWVNAVAPSILDTPANRAAMPQADFTRWAKLYEVAATIAFLASPENRAARGGIVPVFGRN